MSEGGKTALFKNLYLDLSYLNFFKKPAQGNQNMQTSAPVLTSYQPPVQSAPPGPAILQNGPGIQVASLSSPPLPQKKYKELPAVSKRLVSDNHEMKPAEPKKGMELPKFKALMPPAISPAAADTAVSHASIPASKPASQEPMIIIEPKETHEEKTSVLFVKPMHEDITFFSNLSDHLSKEETYIHGSLPKELLNKNLFDEMQTFWLDRKEDMKKNVYHKAIKTELSSKVQELKLLEREWQELQIQHEKIRDELSSKEIIIDNSIRQLKRSLKKMQVSAEIRPEHYFFLSNGGKLKNIQELEDELRRMDDTVFHHHVNVSKNDFANWINDVMQLSDLSMSMRNSKTKEEMANIIDKWYHSG